MWDRILVSRVCTLQLNCEAIIRDGLLKHHIASLPLWKSFRYLAYACI